MMGFFLLAFAALYGNNVSYQFEIKIFIEMFLLCSAFIEV